LRSRRKRNQQPKRQKQRSYKEKRMFQIHVYLISNS
jgi:hypothetical protein